MITTHNNKSRQMFGIVLVLYISPKCLLIGRLSQCGTRFGGYTKIVLSLKATGLIIGFPLICT